MHSSRKRPAPGASPLQPQLQTQQQQQFPEFMDVPDPSQLSDEQFLSWGTSQQASNASLQNIARETTYPSPDLDAMASQSIPSNTFISSGQLVRRNAAQELVSRPNGTLPNGKDAWRDVSNNTARSMSRAWEDSEGEAELERRAAEARKDAHNKRPKQIPPFIQKLSSFLDADANTDLIRWAPDGNSFIVVDEDEFAKNLIPELFKSDKYASFVRQLNMYGFHKKVGLSDNSMRASEKKSKNPSEYYNPYFKRGRPELLWLIQKPKNEPVTKRGKKSKNIDGEVDSADEGKGDSNDATHEKETSQGNMNEVVPVPKGQLTQLQKEIRDLQRAQQHIASVITRLRDDNNQYLRQASAMIAQHERHETSINAILTFLATFYSRSMDGNGNLPNMFTNAIPNSTAQGNVVDVGDYDDQGLNPQPFHQRQGRRPLALLPAPKSSDSANETNTSKSKFRQFQRPQFSNQPFSGQSSHLQLSATNPSSETSATDFREEDNQTKSGNAKEDIMSVIHSLNANANSRGAKSHIDFDTTLRQFERANGKKPLTAEQTENMLSIMADNSGTSAPAFGNQGSHNNAYLEPLLSSQEQLDMLQRLQEEQDSKVQDLADRIQPLSPHGSIPGLSVSGRNSVDLTQEQDRPFGQNSSGETQFNFDGPLDLSPYLDDNYFGTNFDTSSATQGDFEPNLNFGGLQENDNELQTPSMNKEHVEGLFSNYGSFISGDLLANGSTSTTNNNETGPSVGSSYRGRVVGSVSNSSGAPSPKVEETEETLHMENIRSPKKRRKTES